MSVSTCNNRETVTKNLIAPEKRLAFKSYKFPSSTCSSTLCDRSMPCASSGPDTAPLSLPQAFPASPSRPGFPTVADCMVAPAPHASPPATPTTEHRPPRKPWGERSHVRLTHTLRTPLSSKEATWKDRPAGSSEDRTGERPAHDQETTSHNLSSGLYGSEGSRTFLSRKR